MLRKLFYLLALSAHICSAHLRDSFTLIRDKFPQRDISFSNRKQYLIRDLITVGGWENQSLTSKVTSSIISTCENHCLSVENFCRSFAVIVKIQIPEVQCLIFSTKSSEITYSINKSTPNHLLGVYDVKDEFVEDIVARILDDPEILQGQRAKQLLTKHGLSPKSKSDGWELMLEFLRLCNTALRAKPPTEVDFDKWVGGETVAGSRRKSADHWISSNQEITRGVQPSARRLRITENVSSLPFSTLVLAFLDIISQGVGITVFDPLEQTLFIKGPDVHMLVVSFSSTEFAVARFDKSGLIDNANEKIPLQINLFLMSNYDEDRNPSVLEMFEKAMNRFHHKAHDHKAQFSPVFLPSFRPDGDQEINGLQTVLTVIFSHSHPELFDIALKINTKGPLIKNLMNAVVSSVYRNKQKSELFGSNILRTLEVGSLADINIITTGTT